MGRARAHAHERENRRTHCVKDTLAVELMGYGVTKMYRMPQVAGIFPPKRHTFLGSFAKIV